MGLPKCGVLCNFNLYHFLLTFVRVDTVVLLIPALRKALKRYFPIIFPKISCAALGITVPGPNTDILFSA